MTIQPSLTVITLSYNSSSTILDTIRSVNSQVYSPIFHLFIDGFSTDNTLQLIRDHSICPHKVVSFAPSGIYPAMNHALDLVSTDLFLFLNSDDFFFDKYAISRVAACFLDETIDAVYSDLIYISRNYRSRLLRYWFNPSRFTKSTFMRGLCPPHPSFALRTRLLPLVGQFDTSYSLAADYDFMLRCLCVFHFNSIHLTVPSVYMRHGGATSSGFSSISKQNKEILSILSRHGMSVNPFVYVSSRSCIRLLQYCLAFVLSLLKLCKPTSF